jgi:aromatic ring hydroxylase-like protein
VPRLMRRHRVSDALRRTLSGLGIAYQVPAGTVRSPAAGTRVPDLPLTVEGRDTRLYELMRDGRPHLIDTEGGAHAAAAPWRHRVALVRARGPLVGPATALLVRPDGYLAWSGEHPGRAEVRTVLTQWFGSGE